MDARTIWGRNPATIFGLVQAVLGLALAFTGRRALRTLSVGGTVIVAGGGESSDRVVKSIAYKEGITLITITSTRMLMMHGFLARVFEVFASHGTSVDVIATSEVSLSLTVDSRSNLDAISGELKKIAEVEEEHDKAIFCVVGEGLKKTRGIVAGVFSVLDREDIPVSMISLGASEINVTFVVDGKDIRRTAQALHRAFFPVP